MANIASLVVNIGANISGLTSGLAKATAEVSEFGNATNSIGDRLQALGGGMKVMGTAMTAGITLPLAGAGGAALKFAMDWEQAMTGVSKTVDATPEVIARIGDELTAMSEKTPIAREELAGIAEAAGQLGIEVDNIVAFTKTMADLGVSTNMSGEEAATSLARLANITQMSQKDFDRLGSTVVDLGNNFATTEREIVEMGLRMASAGEIVGLSEAQILSFAASLSSVGIEAEAGGSAFSRVMVDMMQAVSKGGAELEALARVAGVSGAEFGRAFGKDAGAAIGMFVAGLGRIQSTGGDVNAVLEEMGWNDIRIGNAMRSLATSGDLVTRALDTGTAAWEKNTALAQEADKFYGTLKNRLKAFGNEVRNTAASLGEQLTPMFETMMTWARSALNAVQVIVDAFAGLPAPVQAAIVALLGLVAALGPVIAIVGTFIAAIGLAAPALAGLGITLGGLVSVIGVVLGAVAGLIALWALYREEIAAIVKQVAESLWPALKDLGSVLIDLGKALWEVGSVLNPVLLVALKVVGAAVVILLKGVTLLATVIVKVLTVAIEGWVRVFQLLGAALDAVVNGVKGFIQKFGNAWKGFVDRMTSLWTAMWDAIRNRALAAWNWLVNLWNRAKSLLSGMESDAQRNASASAARNGAAAAQAYSAAYNRSLSLSPVSASHSGTASYRVASPAASPALVAAPALSAAPAPATSFAPIININGSDKSAKEIAREVHAELRALARAAFGDETRWSEVM